VWALVSLCLGYPDATLVGARAQLASAADALPDGQARRHLKRFTDWFAEAPEPELTVQYVRTFDMRRDTSLNLTYHSHGETRRRGLALLELKRRLRACGMVPEDGELPDHLPLLLEVAAVEPEHGAPILRLVRPGIEMLRRGLTESPYRHLVDALAITLGPADTTTSSVVDELVVLGPPVEEVGAEPAGLSCPGPPPEPLPFPHLRSGRPAPTCSPEVRSAPGGVR
jgi:nitrate reductase delta subunit